MTAQKKIFSKGLLHMGLLAGAILQLLPFVWALSTSLLPANKLLAVNPQFFAGRLEWGNYLKVFTTVPFGRYYFNSILVAVFHTSGTILVSSMAAYAFARLRFPGRDKIFLLYLATMMIPAQVKMVPTFITLKIFHLLDSYAALILPNIFTAFGTFLLRQFFLTLPRELEEAAVVDGETHFGIFLKIVLPLSRPALATLAIYSFLQSWNQFMWPLIVVSRQELMTIPLGISAFTQEYFTQWNLMMAAVVLSIFPVVLVFFFAQKQFIEGITLTGIK
jgi:multiple sugar transport system permease protein